MGLFGYNEKDFAKNTDRFKQQIEEIMRYADPATRRMLTATLLDLGEAKFGGSKKGKALADIDGVIGDLLAKMVLNAHDRKTGCLLERARQLSVLVGDNRRHGEIKYTHASLEQQDKLAEILGKINDFLNQQQAMTDRQAAILAEARTLPADSAERAKLQFEYNRLSGDIERTKSLVFEHQKRYNAACDALKEMGYAAELIELSDTTVVTPQEYSAVTAKAAKAVERMHATDDTLTEITKANVAERRSYAQGTPMDDPFSAAMAQQEAEGVSAAIGSATVSGQAEEDPFTRAMNDQH